MQIVLTAAVAEAMKDKVTENAVLKALRQFSNNEWGKVPQEDKEANNADLRAGTGRILARYETPAGDIYIISYPGTDTPATVLFCQEY